MEKEYVLEAYGKDVLVIGRSRDSDIIVDNPKTSGHHGCFYMQDGRWFYQDLNSTNGTSINGLHIMTTQLQNGMKFVLDSSQWPDSCCVEVVIEDAMQEALGETAQLRSVEEKNEEKEYSDNRRQENLSFHIQQRQNIWGMAAGVAWAILGLISLVRFIQAVSTIGKLDWGARLSGESGFIVVLLYSGLFCITVGLIALAVSLFLYKKKFIYEGADVLAAGFLLIVGAVFYLIIRAAGDYFGYLFQSAEFVFLLVAIILFLTAFILLSRNFKRNYRMQVIGNRYYAPSILFALAWIILWILTGSRSARSGSVFSSSSSLLGGISIGNVLFVLLWFVAILLSCIYLHVDESPILASKYKIGDSFGGRYYHDGNNGQNK
ncbi:MAG: FHA domain-containing protein [Eubacterium sp.]|nr:FHA domain-containing protein [Eubacterium sp.]